MYCRVAGTPCIIHLFSPQETHLYGTDPSKSYHHYFDSLYYENENENCDPKITIPTN